MRRKLLLTYWVIFLLALSSNSFSNTLSNSSTIPLQVVVSESMSEYMATKDCTFGFTSNALNLSHQRNQQCKYNSDTLLREANRLASHLIRQQGDLEIVTLTITAP